MALSKINTNSIADDAVTTAKVNPAQTDITSVGTLTSFASTGIDDNADATTMTIDTSENVGIGNTSPSSQYMTRLVVGDGSGTEGITIYSGNDSSGRLEFSDATSGDGRYAGGIVYEHNNNKLRFNTNGGNERLSIDSSGNVALNVGNLAFSAGKGIDFSNATDVGTGETTSSSILNDYEEGTFSVGEQNSSLGMTLNFAHYTKIGRTVHFALGVTFGSGTDSSPIQLTGMPFDGNNGVIQAVSVFTQYTGGQLIPIVQGSTIFMSKNNATVDLTYTDVSGKYVRMSGTYQIL